MKTIRKSSFLKLEKIEFVEKCKEGEYYNGSKFNEIEMLKCGHVLIYRYRSEDLKKPMLDLMVLKIVEENEEENYNL